MVLLKPIYVVITSKIYPQKAFTIQSTKISPLEINPLYGIKNLWTRVVDCTASAKACGLLVVMCDNDFTTLSIIMTILSRYDSYHNSSTNSTNY